MARPNAHEAMIHLMVVTSAADREMTDAELRRIGDIVRNWPVFEGFDEAKIIPAARRCHDAIAAGESPSQVIGAACEIIPERLADTAYALAYEVACVDLEMRLEELRVLDLVRTGLGVSQDVVNAIQRANKARTRVLT